MSGALRKRAEALDAADPLRQYHARFAHPDAPDGGKALYLCGHSLGLMPLAARECVTQELDDWARLGVEGHHLARRDWIGYSERLTAPLARLAGAGEHEVVAMNSLTVNLHLLMASFYRPSGRRRCVVIEQGAFPSDRHAVTSQLHWHGLPGDALVELPSPTDTDGGGERELEALLGERGEDIALVLWPGVQYRSGRAFDLRRIAAAAHAAGACCGFDLAHSIGNMPLALHADGADFAVWCSYKYLNAGPGAIGGAFVHERHARAALPGLAGWWGHDPETRFRMGPEFVPARGAAGWQVSNPPILSTAPLLASLAIFDSAGMEALRAKSLQMGSLLVAELDSRFAEEVELLTPRAAAQRGSQLSLRLRGGRDRGRGVFEAMGRAGAVMDWREPDVLRLSFVPLYNRFADVARFCELLASALAAQQGPTS
jgi:kynureninase